MTAHFPNLVRHTSAAESPFDEMIRRPGQLLCPDAVPFPNAEKAVRRHLYMLRLPSKSKDAALILAIQGNIGTGKTLVACDTCLKAGYAVALVNPGFLSSEVEGGASAKLAELMRELVRLSRLERRRYVVVKDDMDTAIYARGENEGVSVNRRLLTGDLQHIADHRPYRNWDDTPIPVIATGNSFAEGFRDSLLRDLRANFHTHEPNAQQRAHIVVSLFGPQTWRDRWLMRRLLRRHRGEPIAFWRAVRNDLDALRLDRLIDDGVENVEEAEQRLATPLTFDARQLWSLANARRSARAASFLKHA
jgi:hypothetical protein